MTSITLLLTLSSAVCWASVGAFRAACWGEEMWGESEREVTGIGGQAGVALQLLARLV